MYPNLSDPRSYNDDWREPRTYECRVCGLGILNPDQKVYDGYGWAHFFCTDDYTDPQLRTERP